MCLLIISLLFVVAVTYLFNLNVFINHFSFICSCCSITLHNCLILMCLLIISLLFVVAVTYLCLILMCLLIISLLFVIAVP